MEKDQGSLKPEFIKRGFTKPERVDNEDNTDE
jgi:hypothetical protein